MANTITVGATKEDSDGSSLLKMDKDGVIDLSGKKSITLKVGENYIEISENGIIIQGEKAITLKSNGMLVSVSETESIYQSSSTMDIESTGAMTIKGSGSDIN